MNRLDKGKAPPFIRTWCAVYLGVLKYQAGFKALVAALDNSDPQVAEGAAHGLGAYAGPEAARALLARLRKAKGPEETAWLAENILFTKDHGPQVFQGLMELADRNNLEVLQAMARFGPPELFPYFQARANREKKWRGVVAQGLWTTGREKSVPSLLKMLEKDQPPAGSPLQRSELVDSLAFSLPLLEAPEWMAGAVHLANLGNLSATQVLAEWKQEAVRTVLIRLAGNARSAQAEVALDGLVRNWPQESFETFREALQSTNAAILRLALLGLGRSQNPAARELITHYLAHANSDVRSAAAAALRELPN